MRKILLLIILAACITGQAQTRETDSLRILLSQQKTDTNRVWLLGELSHAYLYSQPDSALYLVKEGLALSRKIGFEEGEAYSLIGLGNAFRITGNYPRALEAYFQSLQIYEDSKDQENITNALVNIGTVYTDLADYRQALAYYFKAIQNANAIKDRSGIAIPLLNIGDSYEKLDLLDSARIYTQQAYEAALRSGDASVIGMALSNLGNIHFKMKQHTLAMEYYRLSLPHFTAADDNDGLSEASFGIAKIFGEAGSDDSAIIYARRSLDISRTAGFTKRILDVSSFMVQTFSKKNQVDSSYAYIQLLMMAKDSLFNQEKVREVQNMTLNEDLRQQELAEERAKAEEERRHNTQLMGIAAFIILFVVFLLLIISKRTSPRTIQFFGVIALLLIFEFLSLLIHPFIEKITHHTPVLMLLILVGIAAILVPLHHKLEHFIKERLVNKARGER